MAHPRLKQNQPRLCPKRSNPRKKTHKIRRCTQPTMMHHHHHHQQKCTKMRRGVVKMKSKRNHWHRNRWKQNNRHRNRFHRPVVRHRRPSSSNTNKCANRLHPPLLPIKPEIVRIVETQSANSSRRWKICFRRPIARRAKVNLPRQNHHRPSNQGAGVDRQKWKQTIGQISRTGGKVRYLHRRPHRIHPAPGKFEPSVCSIVWRIGHFLL